MILISFTITSILITLISYMCNSKIMKDSFLSLLSALTAILISSHGIYYGKMIESGELSFQILLIYWIIDLINVIKQKQIDMIFHHIFCIIGATILLCIDELLIFSPYIIIVEISTIFYHFKLIMDNLHKRNTFIYNLNGMIFFVSFFVCRILAIPIICIKIYDKLNDQTYRIIALIFMGILWILSSFWFYKMIFFIKRMLNGKLKNKKIE